jgi:hypothetical protein
MKNEIKQHIIIKKKEMNESEDKAEEFAVLELILNGFGGWSDRK